jgi:hypothetical protein
MLHITAAQRKALGVSPAELDTAVARGIPLLGYRFRDDKICPREKFDTLREKFGSRFEGHEIAGDKHAVLTISYDPSNPELRGARLRVIEFLRSQLQH